jgi:membrane protease YdiL (CAAX protease family)
MIHFLIGLLIALGAGLLVARRMRYFELVRHPSNWKIMTWRRTLLISLAFFAVAFLVIPNVEVGTKEIVGPTVDPAEHPQVQIIHISPWLLLALVTPIALLEELVFRGIFLDFIRHHSNVIVALILSSFMFSFYHFANPGTLPPFLLIGMVAGILFGVAYLKAGVLGSFLVHGGYNISIVVLGAIL